MKMNVTLDVNALTNSETAFSCFPALMVEVLENGYAPSLRRGNSRQYALGMAVESRGGKVFWK